MKTSSHKSSLNSKQLRLINLTYKFRYITPIQMAKYERLTSRAINYRLKILEDVGYIGKFYDSSYKLAGKGASYYLTIKGINCLKSQPGINLHSLRLMYKNKSLSEAFIAHNLDVFSVYLNLRDNYPGVFNMFTRSELGDFDYFPEPKQDLYLHRVAKSTNKPIDYLLEIFTDTPTFIIKKRLALYINHYDEDDWQYTTKTDYPVLLIACPNPRVEDSIGKHLIKILDNMGIDELAIYTTTVKALMSSNNTKTIWRSIYEPDGLVEL